MKINRLYHILYHTYYHSQWSIAMLKMSHQNVYMLAALLYRDIVIYVEQEQKKGEQKYEIESQYPAFGDRGPRNTG